MCIYKLYEEFLQEIQRLNNKAITCIDIALDKMNKNR